MQHNLESTPSDFQAFLSSCYEVMLTASEVIAFAKLFTVHLHLHYSVGHLQQPTVGIIIHIGLFFFYKESI